MSSVESLSDKEEEEVYSSSSEEEYDDSQNKRIKLAKDYLNSIEEDDVEGTLNKDLLEKSNKVNKYLADHITLSTKSYKQKLTLTHSILTFSRNEAYFVYASKDNTVTQFNFSTKQKHRLPTRNPLCLATSPCYKWLAVGTANKKVDIYNTLTSPFSLVTTLPGFKDAVSALAFRQSTPTALFAASLDRTIKVYSFPSNPPDSPSYVETLYGHQDQIYDLSVLRADIALSVGCRDKTARYWKVVDESQLVFRGGGRSKLKDMLDGAIDFDAQGMEIDGQQQPQKSTTYVEGSLDCCTMVDDQHFLTGGDSGNISLWNTGKKKAIYTNYISHGIHQHHSETEGIINQPRSITSIRSLPYSDLFASGSYDGWIRIWKLDKQLKSFEKLTEIEAKGFINSLQIIQPPRGIINLSNEERETSKKSTDELVIVAATGQEPRMGRWTKLPSSQAKNAIVVSHTKLQS
ncbi:WD40 repeat-like protein [Wallemia mellicola CBS 633.66]|uniref:WD40 repeat-like protein n=1 Tax=Wallemia mellicola (strain ATCC MYA-4683 / CBS 633.66) TaxID=671144 RepID=I4YJV7_WALMC|nr:WD40 repeat-like protein [Wallemia mellicola CBS 633.66]EIM24249.1 WD40 repeat-like protein [Wallemia mellicola CBS 633.66]|eukprot:XP_006956065.1 WD40 repeat-like protein [Wallemia mellicola CBS 633.66]